MRESKKPDRIGLKNTLVILYIYIYITNIFYRLCPHGQTYDEETLQCVGKTLAMPRKFLLLIEDYNYSKCMLYTCNNYILQTLENLKTVGKKLMLPVSSDMI